MAKCTATASSGGQCKANALKGDEYCFWHSPSQGHERAKARKKGGERRRTPHVGDPFTLPETFETIATANKILDYTLAEVLPMENSISRARVLLSIHESYIKVIEVGELEKRLTDLEALLLRQTVSSGTQSGTNEESTPMLLENKIEQETK